MSMIDWAERGWTPDRLIRIAIRRLLKIRLGHQHISDVELQSADFARQIESLTESEIAIETDAANQQHYEVPADFYRLVLGEHLKYSSGLWPPGVDHLDQAEQNARHQTRKEHLADRDIRHPGIDHHRDARRYYDAHGRRDRVDRDRKALGIALPLHLGDQNVADHSGIRGR